MQAIEVEALADSGAITLCIPEHLAKELDLAVLETREVTTADGKKQTVPYVGPLQIGFGNRGCFGGAMVMGKKVLLGAIQMEDMDLILHPRDQIIIPNPENPNSPGAIVMSHQVSHIT